MKIVPLSNIQASIEIDSNRIGFVRLGNEVDISIDSYPASDFGVIKGSINTIKKYLPLILIEYPSKNIDKILYKIGYDKYQYNRFEGV